MLAEVASAVKAALSLCVLSEHYHLPTQEHTDSCSPYRQYWRSMTGRERGENYVHCSKPLQSRRKEKLISSIVVFQGHNLSPFPMPAVRCKQSIPFSALPAAPAAPYPPELEVQDTVTLELHWFFPGAGCCGEVQMGEVQHTQSQTEDILS